MPNSGMDTPTNRSWYAGSGNGGGGSEGGTPAAGRSRQSSLAPDSKVSGTQTRKSSQQSQNSWGGLDQGIITEIEKLREYMRLEKLMKERGGRELTQVSSEQTTEQAETVSEADTHLEEERCK